MPREKQRRWRNALIYEGDHRLTSSYLASCPTRWVDTPSGTGGQLVSCGALAEAQLPAALC